MTASTARQYGRDDVDFATWYTPWMTQLAADNTRAELDARLGTNRGAAPAAGRTHLGAIARTHSMTSHAQARAQARNVVVAIGDEAIALRGALEIHDLFPEHAKGGAS